MSSYTNNVCISDVFVVGRIREWDFVEFLIVPKGYDSTDYHRDLEEMTRKYEFAMFALYSYIQCWTCLITLTSGSYMLQLGSFLSLVRYKNLKEGSREFHYKFLTVYQIEGLITSDTDCVDIYKKGDSSIGNNFFIYL